MDTLISSYNLSQDALFKNRIQESLAGMAQFFYLQTPQVGNRRRLATSVLNSPATYVQPFANYIATDSTVINAATQNQTVAITSGNADAQEALVTDAQINNAVSAVWDAMAGSG